MQEDAATRCADCQVPPAPPKKTTSRKLALKRLQYTYMYVWMGIFICIYIYMFICTFVVLYYMCVFVGWITVWFTCRISSFRYGWFYRKTWLPSCHVSLPESIHTAFEMFDLHLWSTHWFIITIPIKLATWGYYTFFSDTPQIKYVYICLYRLFPALYPQ